MDARHQEVKMRVAHHRLGMTEPRSGEAFKELTRFSHRPPDSNTVPNRRLAVSAHRRAEHDEHDSKSIRAGYRVRFTHAHECVSL